MSFLTNSHFLDFSSNLFYGELINTFLSCPTRHPRPHVLIENRQKFVHSIFVVWNNSVFYPIINSQAVGMDSWVQSALKSILRGDRIFESAAWFFFIILKFIFTAIFEIKIHGKKFLDTKKFHFRSPISINQHVLHWPYSWRSRIFEENEHY